MQKFNFILMLLSILLLTGCYGKNELDDLAYVIAIGVDDYSGDGNENNKEILATYQIALPVKLAGDSNETGKEVYETFTVKAKSLEAANSKINTMTSKEINLSHTKLILYSEELARESLEGHINSFLSNHAIRPKTVISVCKGKAKDFLENITPVLESSPARYYELILSSFNYTGKLAETEILNFYANSKASFKSPIAVMASLTDNDEGKFGGLALFKSERMVGEIEEDLVFSHLILTNSLSKDIFTVDDIEDDAKTLTFTIKQTKKTKVKVNIKENVPYVDINIFLDAHLEGNGGDTDYLKKENKEKLREILESRITKLVYEYLNKTTTLSVDPAGIGRYAKMNYLTYPEFEKCNWPEIYKNSKFNINTKIELNVAQIVSHSKPEQVKSD